jgi:hypothetical protein
LANSCSSLRASAGDATAQRFRRSKYIDIKGSTLFVTNAGALQAAVTI